MKKFLFFLILIMSLSLSLFACGGGSDSGNEAENGGNQNDGGSLDNGGNQNGDGGENNGDEGEPEVQASLPLFIEGEPTFNIIMANDLSSNALSAIKSVQYKLKTDFNIDVVLESESYAETETEILIGNVKSRGEKYSLDGHTLGNEGYAVRLVGTKVLINAGSDEKLTYAINEFAKDVIGIKKNKIKNVTMEVE